MREEKELFVTGGLADALQQLNADAVPAWGVMNAQEMVEHVNDFYNVSLEKIVFPCLTPADHLPKYKEFLYSDKPFKENTKAPAEVLGDRPLPLRTSSLQDAKSVLTLTVNKFKTYFDSRDGYTSVHPVFGALTYEEWCMLHYKHVQHHFKQFGLIK
jgi:oxepin-CoA hydrolase/3-oxo-5,6-dehydrosuberyl-CoA semialdehyde dehydrogenase